MGLALADVSVQHELPVSPLSQLIVLVHALRLSHFDHASILSLSSTILFS